MAIETIDLTLQQNAVPFEGLPTIAQQYSGIPIRALEVAADASPTLITAGNNLLVRAVINLPESGAFILTDMGVSVGSSHFPTVTGLRCHATAGNFDQYLACNSWGIVSNEDGSFSRIYTPERLPTWPINGPETTSNLTWWTLSDATLPVGAFPVHFWCRFLEYDQLQFDGYQINTPVVTVH